MLRHTERMHYSREQVEQHVRDALEVAGACGLTDEERAVLLPGILDKLSSKQIITEQIELGPNMVVPTGRG
jgi:hypothetical protein